MSENGETQFESDKNSFDSGIFSQKTNCNENLIKFNEILGKLNAEKKFRDELRKRLSQLTDRRGKKKKLEPCNVCFAELDVEDIKTCVPCCSCEKSVCRGKNCSYWLPKYARWECQLCNLSKASQCRTTEWINKQAKPENEIYHPIRARSELNIPILDDRMSMTGSVNYLPAYSPVPSVYGMNLDKQKIRNHVEEILAEMLGGSLDNISVGPMSRSTQYLPLWESNSTNNLDTTNPTNISHIKLKRLIERIIDETLRIPQLTDFSGVPPHLTAGSDNLLHQHYERRNKHRNSNRRYCNKISKSNDDFSYEVEGNNPQYFDPKRYQELLATAVLNKIVDTCAAEKRSVSEASVKKIDNNHNKIPITAEVCIESSSSSSHDPQSDSSLTDPVQDLNHINLSSRLYADALNENFNLESTISENSASFRNIPEVISSDNDSIEDYVSVASGADSTWEENWLFKKRKLLTHPTAPIGMLVPAPKEDIKAMIGDKSADEISDFSENDESDEINANAPENDRIQNKVVIGGQNIVGLFDDLLEQTSFISQSSSLTENMSPYTETKNNYVDYKYGLNVSENSSLDLTCSGMTLKTEAVNTAVAVNVMKCDKNTNSQENELNNNTECEDSKYSEIIVGERTSSDSTITDESTHTILDATDEAQIFSAKENSNQHSTKIYINGNNDQEGVLNIETSSEIDNVVLENTQTVTNNMEIGDSNVNDNKISTLTININNDLNNINLTEYNEIFIDSNNNTNTNVTNNEKNSVNVTYAINNQNSVLTSEKIEPLDSTSTNTIPKLIDIKKTEAFCRTLDMSDEDDQSISLIPGSIAEREHKKWYNAVEMPNNPYAPEALLRRLDTGPEKPLDIPDKRVSTPITTPEEEKIAEEALNTKKVDLSIYSRDYYVPSPTSNGTKNKLMKMPVIDMDSLQSDEKSFEENNSTLPVISEKIQNSSAKLNEQNDKPSISNIFDTKSDIFSAKLIQIVDSIDEEQYKKVNVSKTDSSPSDISLTNSLTLSEDSDTLRIYNLNKQETTFLTKENQLKKQQSIEESQNNNDNSRTPPNTPVTPTIPQAAPRTPRTRPNELKLTSESSQSSIKTGKTAMALTPQSFKFLHPKRKIIEPSQIMSHEQYSTPPETPDKLVIEEDVVSSLPSVKALARAFLLTTAKTTLSDDKISTKSLIVDSKNNEITQNKKKSSLGENSTIEEPSVEAMQDENQNNLQNSERPISPILKPGKLKDNIAFFENLKKNE